MLVTINTDASFSNASKYGSYAFYIKSSLFCYKKANVLKEKCRDPTDAENKAIYNAIYFLLKMHGKSVKSIIVNTDSLNSIHLFSGDKVAIKKYGLRKHQSILHKLQSLLNKPEYRNISVQFRHVKAHNGAPDARSWVNDWCDEQAKFQLGLYLTKNNLWKNQ